MTVSSLMRLIVEQLRGHLEAEPVAAYFVGGCVRDLLLGRPLHDLDLVVAGDAIAMARLAARAFRAAFVLLDEDNGIARVVLRRQEGEDSNTIDFARMRGNSLAEDLAARDLTINAMAMSPSAFWGLVSGAGTEADLIDPCGGREDLQAGRLRAPSAQSFLADPLRTMRAVRFAAELGFVIVPETKGWIREAAALLPRVSGERIRDELVRLLLCPQAAPYLPLLAELELLPHVLPELAGPAGRQEQAWETVSCLEWIIAGLRGNSLPAEPGPYRRPAALSACPTLHLELPHPARLWRYTEERLAERPRRALLKLAALLRPTEEEPSPQGAVAGRLRLSTREGTLLARLGEWPAWARKIDPSPRCVYRLYRDAGEGATGVLLLILAAELAQAGPRPDLERWQQRVALVAEILKLAYEQGEQVIHPPPLIDGHELTQRLGLRPGPLVGELLEGLREAQAAGEVRTPEQALEWARQAMAR